MKQHKIIYAILSAIIAILLICLFAQAKGETNYYKYAENLGLAEIVDADKLTTEDLTARNGKLIIERVIGVVEDSNGNGHALNDESYYINYRNLKGAKTGNIVCSYLIYDPDTNFEDDVVARYDYIIDMKTN